jgi:hypothetical protein
MTGWKPVVRDSFEGYPPKKKKRPDVDLASVIRLLVDVCSKD